MGGVGEQQITPFKDSVSSFGENVDASLSNSVVAEDKQAAFVSLVIQYYTPVVLNVYKQKNPLLGGALV